MTGLWLLADSFFPEPFTYFAFRTPFVQYTGILGMGMMSLAMILAVRPLWLEPWLNGLDKMYRLHKWLGIGGLVLSVLHWWWGQGSKWMVGWGWLDKPDRKPLSGDTLDWLAQLLRSQRGLAETLGEWAFYVSALLIILALIKSFPYHWFKFTHKYLAIAYLILVYHSIILMQYDYWNQPIAWISLALILYGAVAAILILTGRMGIKRKVSGTLRSMEYYPALATLEGNIQLNDGWPGHHPGQFAFVSDHTGEAAHPYTIASAWDPDTSCLRFAVKELGDWTGQLHKRLNIGMDVTIEGPYGCFDFNDSCPRQIWVGAGIGITPFIAKLEARAQSQDVRPVDLFHVTAVYDEKAMSRLKAIADATGVRLHIRVTTEQGRLTPEQIRAAVPEWQHASLWFCGPSAFSQKLRDDLIRHGLQPEHYHQELFEMR
nr:ferric reductase-like transmembrane domain-containing protein [Oceanospirillum sediminis]